MASALNFALFLILFRSIWVSLRVCVYLSIRLSFRLTPWKLLSFRQTDSSNEIDHNVSVA